ncbi:MAG TPA: ThuA domain-containing protein [Bryobacteraceae bacterium]|nr:ThuA domain-containing protein [Bryobacteraceae bacterium]
MIKRLVLIAIVVAGLISAQGPGRAGSKSLRPAEGRRVRTVVNSLLAWRMGIPATVFRALTFSEAAAMADALGLGSIEGDSQQRVSPQIAKNLDAGLSPEEVTAIKARLNELRLKMTAWHVASLGSDNASMLRTFQFAKDLGVETIISGSLPQDLASADRMAGEAGVNVAIENRIEPAKLAAALAGRSERLGACADLGAWQEQGIRPVEGLAALGTRVIAVYLRDRSALGGAGRDVTVGSGAAGLERFFLDLAKLAPEPTEDPAKCANCGRPYGGLRPVFIGFDIGKWEATDQFQVGSSGDTFADLWKSIEGFEKVVRPAMGYRVELDSHHLPITPVDRLPAAERQKIEAALPRTATTTPRRHRKLLVLDICPAGAFFHATAAHANFAIEQMAKNTGAYEAVFSNDLTNLKYPAIQQFDAVFLNSGDGEVFADPEVLEGLMRFVHEGGGFASLHGGSYASMDVPEFGEFLGAQDGPHRVEPATLKVDDPSSPITAAFDGADFNYTDEFYHFLPTGPYSREKLHVLLSIDAAKSDLSNWHVRPDNDYGLVWIRSYGQGRIFNCAMGHTPTLFSTPAMAKMMLAAIQFVLGDLAADTTPSALLNTRGR